MAAYSTFSSEADPSPSARPEVRSELCDQNNRARVLARGAGSAGGAVSGCSVHPAGQVASSREESQEEKFISLIINRENAIVWFAMKMKLSVFKFKLLSHLALTYCFMQCVFSVPSCPLPRDGRDGALNCSNPPLQFLWDPVSSHIYGPWTSTGSKALTFSLHLLD